MSLPPLGPADLLVDAGQGFVEGWTIQRVRDYAAQAVAESKRDTDYESSEAKLRDDELAEWRKLQDPAVLHANLLRGFPAQLDSATFMHLAGEGALAKAVAEAVEDLQAACEWYGDEARALAKNLESGAHSQAVLASVTVLALDAGRRAHAAIRARSTAHPAPESAPAAPSGHERSDTSQDGLESDGTR